jgi:NAD(P)-dependent dehydrogenase (short-subunit alcohol dehydrogenase family)
MRLKDKVALIAGGAGGMGRASARLFARESATVFVAARRPKPGAALVQEIEAAGGRAYFIQLDTTRQAGWNAAVADVKKKAGALQVLLNIVGTNHLTLIPNISMEEWNKVFEVRISPGRISSSTEAGCPPLLISATSAQTTCSSCSRPSKRSRTSSASSTR